MGSEPSDDPSVRFDLTTTARAAPAAPDQPVTITSGLGLPPLAAVVDLEAELGMDSWIGSFVRALAARFREAEDRLAQGARAALPARVGEAIRVHLAALGTGAAPWSSLAAALAAELGLPAERIAKLAGESDELELDLERDLIRRR